MQIVTRELTRFEREKLAAHLLELDAEDRRLRFGLPVSDDTIREYVEGIENPVAERIAHLESVRIALPHDVVEPAALVARLERKTMDKPE